jgi:hypothetical protein
MLGACLQDRAQARAKTQPCCKGVCVDLKEGVVCVASPLACCFKGQDFGEAGLSGGDLQMFWRQAMFVPTVCASCHKPQA